MRWTGSDVTASRARWHGIAAGDLQALSADLRDARLELSRQAEEQRVASDRQRRAAMWGAAVGAATAARLLAATAPSRPPTGQLLGRITAGPAVAARLVTGAGLARSVLLGHARTTAAVGVSALVRRVPRAGAATVFGWLAGATLAGPTGAIVGAVLGYRWAAGTSDGSAADGGPPPADPAPALVGWLPDMEHPGNQRPAPLERAAVR